MAARGRRSSIDGDTRGLQPLMGRLAHEFVCLWEFWLLPLAVALLPYRVGIAFARWCAPGFRSTTSAPVPGSRITARPARAEMPAGS